MLCVGREWCIVGHACNTIHTRGVNENYRKFGCYAYPRVDENFSGVCPKLMTALFVQVSACVVWRVAVLFWYKKFFVLRVRMCKQTVQGSENNTVLSAASEISSEPTVLKSMTSKVASDLLILVWLLIQLDFQFFNSVESRIGCLLQARLKQLPQGCLSIPRVSAYSRHRPGVSV